MILLVTAPIRFDFCLNYNESAYRTDKFYSFWKQLDSRKKIYKEIDKINYYQKSKENRQDSSYDNKSKTDLKIIGLVLQDVARNVLLELKEQNTFIEKYFKNILYSEIKIYDNTIGIFDLRIELEEIFAQDYSHFSNEAELLTKIVLKEILSCTKDSIELFLRDIKRADRDKILKAKNLANGYNDFVDFHYENKALEIMWASCALKFEDIDSDKTTLIKEWLKNVGEKEALKVSKSSSAYSLDWLKYAFREDVANYDELWDTMFLAQYYYSVIEVIINNLKMIIHETYKDTDSRKKSFLKFFKKDKIILDNQKIESISATAYITITQYRDIRKYLNRTSLEAFNQTMNAWTFEEILENTGSLLDIAKGRVSQMYNKISSKNNFYTDTLLTSIGFFAIIDLVLSFSQYSREYTADSMISSRGSDENSFLHVLSSIPTDTFIGSGFFVSILLLVFYFIYRKKLLP